MCNKMCTITTIANTEILYLRIYSRGFGTFSHCNGGIQGAAEAKESKQTPGKTKGRNRITGRRAAVDQ